MAFQIISICAQFYMIIFICHTGSSTTEEAEQTPLIIGQLMFISESARIEKILRQIQARNLKLRNIFFTVDFDIFLVVSL